MKITHLVLAGLIAQSLLVVWPAHAQYSASRLTRRIAPQLQPPPSRNSNPRQRPAPPAPAPADPNATNQTAAAAPAPAPAARSSRAPAARQPAVRRPYVPPVYSTNSAPEDPEVVQRVVEFQKKRANEGQPSAQYELGMRYLNGNGVEKDPTEARKWLGLSAKNGYHQAQKKLEEMPAESKETTRDKTEKVTPDKPTPENPKLEKAPADKSSLEKSGGEKSPKSTEDKPSRS